MFSITTRRRGFAVGFIVLISILLTSAVRINGQSDQVSLKDRVWMASKIYSSVRTYFGHWQAVPNLDLDAEYKKFVDRMIASESRRDFDLAALEFVASLKNGHSDFYDRGLLQSEGKPVGFMAMRNAEGKWLVNHTDVDSILIGDEIQLIDGKPFDQFFKENERYISGSSEKARQRALFYRPFLFPATFELTLADGRTVAINRQEQKLRSQPPPMLDGRVLEGNIAYVKIPSFEDQLFDDCQSKAMDFIQKNRSARAFIIDVRGNGGGSTPSKLIAALMDRPYRDWVESTSANMGLYGAYNQLRNIVAPAQQNEGLKTTIDMSSQLEQVQIQLASRTIMPQNPVYRGPIIILTDFDCASACEDFVMPMKTSGRAEVYGSATRGSTGQPFMYEFGNGMGFRISAKRAFFPDGTTFEGVGITPTVAIEPTADDVKNGRDPVLERATEALRQGAASSSSTH